MSDPEFSVHTYLYMSVRNAIMEKQIENIEYNVKEIMTMLTTMKVKLDILCNNYQSDVHDRLKLKSLFVKYNEEESK